MSYERDLPPMSDEPYLLHGQALLKMPTKDDVIKKCRAIFGRTADLAITESDNSIAFNVHSNEFQASMGISPSTITVCHILLAGEIKTIKHYNVHSDVQTFTYTNRPENTFVLGKSVKISDYHPARKLEEIRSIVIDNDENSVEKVIALCIDTEKVIQRLEKVIQNTRALEVARKAVSMSLTQETIDEFLNPIIDNINVALQENGLKFGEISNASSITHQTEGAITAAIKSRLAEISVDSESQNLVLKSQFFLPNTHYGKKLNLLDIEQSLSRILEGNVRG